MKRAIIVHLLLALVLGACGQTTSVRSAVRIMATVQPDAPSITLHWQAFPGTTGFTIYRRAAGATTWGNSIAALPGTVLQYLDATVQTGVGYEYKVVRNAGGSGYGYVRSGIAVPPAEVRGKLILLVESAVASALPTELEQLRERPERRRLAGDPAHHRCQRHTHQCPHPRSGRLQCGTIASEGGVHPGPCAGAVQW